MSRSGLRNSCISPSSVRLRPASAAVAVATIVAVWSAVPVSAIDPERTMEQYIHDRWERDRGFPGGAVHGITQSTDGYLWIAADKGLVRFDGLAFQLIPRPGLTKEQDPAVLAVAPDPLGGALHRAAERHD